ncbi:hypothetical protein HMPREF9061_00397 [Actinomyces sp. oral taxon 181 str. F0379]|nr:hypothetical protein HMPREF9061_00397 [Actinomyces sp. oral taxon 181 str. F0379]
MRPSIPRGHTSTSTTTTLSGGAIKALNRKNRPQDLSEKSTRTGYVV